MAASPASRSSGASEPSFVVGRSVGLACIFVGVALAVLWLAIRIDPSLSQRFALLPFFDGPLLLSYERPYVTSLTASLSRMTPVALHLVTALLLIVVGYLILARRRWAPVAFWVSGWGGLAFTLVAIWPGDRLHGKMAFALGAAKKRGMLGADGTLLDLIPSSVLVAAGAFLVIWILLLVAGSVHLLRAREHYRG